MSKYKYYYKCNTCGNEYTTNSAEDFICPICSSLNVETLGRENIESKIKNKRIEVIKKEINEDISFIVDTLETLAKKDLYNN